MSYSRWGNSVWYAYWSAHSGMEKDEQILSVTRCGSSTARFTYQQLKDPVGRRICACWVMGSRTTSAEIDELIGYMEEFVAEIDGTFDKTEEKEE